MSEKKLTFWGRDESDERLLEEVLQGLKTATCTPKVWFDTLPEIEKSSVGDVFEVHTKKGVHRANIEITDIYELPFGEIKGEIGEKIAKAENSTLQQFIDDHIFSWQEPLSKDGYELNERTIIVVEHFKLLSIIKNGK